jgi:hypothetical protein
MIELNNNPKLHEFHPMRQRVTGSGKGAIEANASKALDADEQKVSSDDPSSSYAQQQLHTSSD